MGLSSVEIVLITNKGSKTRARGHGRAIWAIPSSPFPPIHRQPKRPPKTGQGVGRAMSTRKFNGAMLSALPSDISHYVLVEKSTASTYRLDPLILVWKGVWS